MMKPSGSSRPVMSDFPDDPSSVAIITPIEDSEPLRCGYLSCPMCGLIIHQCVTLFPCLHQFCGGCVSGWTQDKYTCPYCSERYLNAKRNLLVDELLEAYLRAHPEDKRTDDDLFDLQRRNLYTDADAIKGEHAVPGGVASVATERRPAEIKQLPPLPPDPRQACFWQGPPKCAQCPRNIDGYRCVRDQEHVECYLCKQYMPCRRGIPQQCHICECYFCNIYYRKAKHCEMGIHTVEWYIKTAYCQIPGDALCDNEYEQSLLKESLRQIGLPLPMLAIKITEEMERTGLSFIVEGKPGVRVQRSTYICNICANSLWKEILMFQRIRINDTLDENIRNRVRCKHGVHCRNQKSIYAHAFKFNHIV